MHFVSMARWPSSPGPARESAVASRRSSPTPARRWSSATSRRTRPRRSRTASAAEGGQAIAVACNVTDDAALEHLVATALDAFGKITILVNNAGGGGPKPFDMPMGDFVWAYQLNVFSVFRLTQLCAPHMEAAGGGAVLNISSMAGENKNVRMASYGSSKAAVNHLTRNIAFDLGPKNIRVNAIAPGAINTDALATVLTPDIEKAMLKHTPLARLGEAVRHRLRRALPLLAGLGVGQRAGAHRQRRRRAGTRLTACRSRPFLHGDDNHGEVRRI